MKKNKQHMNLLEMIKKHIVHNKKEYMVVALLFIAGIFLGVLFVNHIQESQKLEITSYFGAFVENMKNTDSLNYMDLLKTSIQQNGLLAIVLWFFGTTVIGLPVVFGVVLYRGFCLGYTIAVCISVMGFSQGIWFYTKCFGISS